MVKALGGLGGAYVYKRLIAKRLDNFMNRHPDAARRLQHIAHIWKTGHAGIRQTKNKSNLDNLGRPQTFYEYDANGNPVKFLRDANFFQHAADAALKAKLKAAFDPNTGVFGQANSPFAGKNRSFANLYASAIYNAVNAFRIGKDIYDKNKGASLSDMEHKWDVSVGRAREAFDNAVKQHGAKSSQAAKASENLAQAERKRDIERDIFLNGSTYDKKQYEADSRNNKKSVNDLEKRLADGTIDKKEYNARMAALKQEKTDADTRIAFIGEHSTVGDYHRNAQTEDGAVLDGEQALKEAIGRYGTGSPEAIAAEVELEVRRAHRTMVKRDTGKQVKFWKRMLWPTSKDDGDYHEKHFWADEGLYAPLADK
jgi:hypothetical protein